MPFGLMVAVIRESVHVNQNREAKLQDCRVDALVLERARPIQRHSWEQFAIPYHSEQEHGPRSGKPAERWRTGMFLPKGPNIRLAGLGFLRQKYTRPPPYVQHSGWSFLFKIFPKMGLGIFLQVVVAPVSGK